MDGEGTETLWVAFSMDCLPAGARGGVQGPANWEDAARAPVAFAAAVGEMGFGVTVLNAEGVEGSVRLSFSVVPRRRISEALHAVRATNPNAYVTVERTSAPDLAHQRRMVRA